MFIVFEGVDGCGKTTVMKEVVKLLTEHLGDADRIVTTREPGGTKLAEVLRNMVLNPPVDCEPMEPMTQALIVSAARHQHVKYLIQPSLDAGKIVITDRFYASTFAYQGSQLPSSKLHHLTALTTAAVDGVYPDLTICLFVKEEVAKERLALRNGATDAMEKRTTNSHKTMELFYDGLRRTSSPSAWINIDANKQLGDVVSEVFEYIIKHHCFKGQ